MYAQTWKYIFLNVWAIEKKKLKSNGKMEIKNIIIVCYVNNSKML